MANKFKVGDKVQWVSVKREGSKHGNEIKCVGIVQSVKMSTFGGSRKGMGAMVKVASKAYKTAYGKDWAFVSFEKLQKV